MAGLDARRGKNSRFLGAGGASQFAFVTTLSVRSSSVARSREDLSRLKSGSGSGGAGGTAGGGGRLGDSSSSAGGAAGLVAEGGAG